VLWAQKKKKKNAFSRKKKSTINSNLQYGVQYERKQQKSKNAADSSTHPIVFDDGVEIYLGGKIIGCRIVRNQTQYKVNWPNTWINEKEFDKGKITEIIKVRKRGNSKKLFVKWKPTFELHNDIANDLLANYNGNIMEITDMKQDLHERLFFVQFQNSEIMQNSNKIKFRWEPESMLKEVYPDFSIQKNIYISRIQKNKKSSSKLKPKKRKLTFQEINTNRNLRSKKIIIKKKNIQSRQQLNPSNVFLSIHLVQLVKIKS